MRRVFLIGTVVVILAVAMGSVVFAHGSIDQSFLGFSSSNFNIMANEPIGQQFIPDKNNIIGVDVFLTGGSETITANIRKDTITSPVLATKTQNLAAGTGLFHFDFPSTLTVTPGDTYVLELDGTNNAKAWDDSTDGYAGGCGIHSSGTIDCVGDFKFQTYYSTAAAVPSLSQWGLVFMGGALAVLFAAMARRQRRALRPRA